MLSGFELYPRWVPLLEVLRAAENRLPRDLFRFFDRLGPDNAVESQFAKF